MIWSDFKHSDLDEILQFLIKTKERGYNSVEASTIRDNLFPKRKTAEVELMLRAINDYNDKIIQRKPYGNIDGYNQGPFINFFIENGGFKRVKHEFNKKRLLYEVKTWIPIMVSVF